VTEAALCFPGLLAPLASLSQSPAEQCSSSFAARWARGIFGKLQTRLILHTLVDAVVANAISFA
jgi:hypothetical protein